MNDETLILVSPLVLGRVAGRVLASEMAEGARGALVISQRDSASERLGMAARGSKAGGDIGGEEEP